MPLSSLGSLHVSLLLFPEAGTVLVCHRGRWLLHQPPTGFEDGPVGQVSGGPGEMGGVQEGPLRQEGQGGAQRKWPLTQLRQGSPDL